ncbi:hypothetical protein HK097_004879 [Rhizophlyctis rosea]|uniref:Uncharacterized protein n=1 Tax=Rhizophlyctis rosea TaxID=64517 RepID=A0AAD5X6C0_9FUNG|nr:hypothetical protein HK097_004879 [Rhizophlyctis rosea]
MDQSYVLLSAQASLLTPIARLARTCTHIFAVAYPALYRLCFDFTSQEKFEKFCDLMATSPRAHLYAREVLAIIAIEQECGVSSQTVRKLAKHDYDDRKFPRLQELCFGPTGSKRASPITDHALTAILRQCPALSCVQFDNLNSIKGHCFLRDDANMPVHGLRQLQLRFCDAIPANLFKIIAKFAPNLEELELTHLYPRHLEAISKCHKLRLLSVDHIHVGADEADAFMFLSDVGYIPRIENICLVDADELTTEHVVKMVEKWGPRLKRLALGAVDGVGDDAIMAVAKSCPNLEFLDIGDLGIGDEPLIELIKSCPYLSYLDITYNDLVTDQLLVTLRDHAPQLRVLYASEAIHLSRHAWVNFVDSAERLQSFSAGAFWRERYFRDWVNVAHPEFTRYDPRECEWSIEGYEKEMAPASRFDPLTDADRDEEGNDWEDGWMDLGLGGVFF